jgi:hypothetical protein
VEGTRREFLVGPCLRLLGVYNDFAPVGSLRLLRAPVPPVNENFSGVGFGS